MTSYRALSDWERRVILRLLMERPFAGREELLTQLDEAVARSIDDDGSVSLKCSGTVKAAVITRIPVEGEAPDRDGMMIHYLLHVVDGKMSELEVYKDDSSSVLRHIEPEDLRVMSAG